MPYVRQVEKSVPNGSAVPLLALDPFTPAAHSTLLAITKHGSPANLLTFLDTNDNVWAQVADGNFFGHRLTAWLCQDAKAGSVVCSIGSSGSDVQGIAIGQWAGLVTVGSPLLPAQFNAQNGPGVGNDTITAGAAFVVPSAPARMIGFVVDVQNSSELPNAGTGFTPYPGMWLNNAGALCARFEDRLIAAPATLGVTFGTPGGGNVYETIGIVLTEAAFQAPAYDVAIQIMLALNTVFGSHVYPQVAPDNQAPPYAVYQLVSSSPENTLRDGIPIENDLYQVDVYSTTWVEAQALSKTARAAVMAQLPNTVDRGRGRTLYEAEVKLHRVVLEFSTWSN